MLLEGKKIVVTGVAAESSIAFTVARLAQEQGAEIVLTSFGRAMGLTEKSAKRLPNPVEVLDRLVRDALGRVGVEEGALRDLEPREDLFKALHRLQDVGAR